MPLPNLPFTGCERGHTPPSSGSTHGEISLVRSRTGAAFARATGAKGKGAFSHSPSPPGPRICVPQVRHRAKPTAPNTDKPNNRVIALRIRSIVAGASEEIGHPRGRPGERRIERTERALVAAQQQAGERERARRRVARVQRRERADADFDV